MKSDIKDSTESDLSSTYLATSRVHTVPGSLPGPSFNTVKQYQVLQPSVTGAANLEKVQYEGLYIPDKYH